MRAAGALFVAVAVTAFLPGCGEDDAPDLSPAPAGGAGGAANSAGTSGQSGEAGAGASGQGGGAGSGASGQGGAGGAAGSSGGGGGGSSGASGQAGGGAAGAGGAAGQGGIGPGGGGGAGGVAGSGGAGAAGAAGAGGGAGVGGAGAGGGAGTGGDAGSAGAAGDGGAAGASGTGATGGAGAAGAAGLGGGAGAAGAGGGAGGGAAGAGGGAGGGTAGAGGSAGGGGAGAGGSAGGGAAGAGGAAGQAGSAGAGGASGSGGAGASGAAGAGGSSVAPTCAPPVGTLGALTLTQVATGLSSPLLAKSPPGDGERLFIVEQTGKVRIAKNGALLSTPFADLSSRLVAGGERGLLGLAFHPGYAQNGRFFVHYSEKATGDTIVEEYARSAEDPDVADPAPVAPILHVVQPYANHNGGSIEFGGDGYLYVALGDGGSGGDPENHAQTTTSLLGKILRLDVSASPYAVPPGNLPGGAPEVWDYGLRNPFRVSFDACTGDLYIGDVGQSSWEEIDVEPAGQGNRNYGWKVMEGPACYSVATCDESAYTLPVASYTHAAGCSVTGGYVYRGAKIPALRGRYLYGDYCSGRISSFRWDGAGAVDEIELSDELGNPGNISSFGQDATGELYVVAHGGTVYRIDPE